MKTYDIIIVGAGPGGLTAGIYAGRQGTKTLILDKGLAGGIGREVPEMENYPGFDMISGLELVEKIKEQCIKYVELHETEKVEDIIKSTDKFMVKTNKETYYGKTVILATGSSHKHLGIPGEEEYLGKGVSYCATCDGLFFKDKDVIIVGGGNSALQEALFLENIGCKVTIIHRRNQLRGQQYLQKNIKEKNIKIIYNTIVEKIKGKTFVESVILKNIETNNCIELKTSGVFISIGYIPHNKLAKKLNVKLNENGEIITDKHQKTNVKNVYSAGDICGGLRQWIVACGEGAIAATSAYIDIQQSD
ncbi:thioredoxin-disulfide reductase [uncultured Methanobrevibacter sp.]|uniref:thioredoxin-disulfide reductase n=1 Tax=uncultured Methanobrevibacter sp. TaxID=253161 RepID=UPI00262571A2|nr:thioredoxin-disulfide reductase [uncultured Methanobrevibacter sp.]